ncbi:hypothetical protein [uncultured Hymenobacter sp.]|uniref:hypothetical protein n=1 Tax=uncultured Hymenobacter sp. TaxID=170016 RepID=UPI0035CBDD81
MALDYPEEHQREALAITVGIHALLALLFFFVVFRGPDPPLTDLGGTGVELNYGLDEAGSGDVQSTAPANDSPNREDSRPPAQNPAPQPQPVAAAPVPTPPAEERVITSDAEESPVSAPPVEAPAPPKEEVKETPRPPRKVAVTFTPKGQADGGGNGQSGTSNAPTGNNNGDRPGTVGDQGDARGTLNGDALYGNPGTGGPGRGGSGGGLEMSGWAIDSTPKVEAVDDNSGVVRFKIKITEEGEVEAVTKVSGNVSAAQEKLCRDALTNASFRRTNSGAGGATGFYTFRFTVR